MKRMNEDIKNIQLIEGEEVIDCWDAPVPDHREYITCRVTYCRNQSGYDAQWFDAEESEWTGDGDYNGTLWGRRHHELKKAVRSLSVKLKAAQEELDSLRHARAQPTEDHKA